MLSEKIILVDINKLDDDLWDSRSYKNEKVRQRIEKQVERLAENIKREGLHNPIKIALAKPNGHYSIVTGRLRVRAHKQLGLKQIKCIYTDETNRHKLEDETYSENEQRQSLSLDDNLHRLRSIIEHNGYTLRQAITFAKSLHNEQTKGIRSKTVPIGFRKLIEKLPNIREDKSQPMSDNYLYQVLTTMEYINDDVQDVFEQYGLSMMKRILLTNTNLRKHPVIQKSLVAEIAGLSFEKSRIVVLQKIRDIETKALIKTGKDSYTIDIDKREKIDTRTQIVKNSVMKYLDILDNANDLMFTLTGHKRLSGESEYTQKHIDFSETFRIDILNGLAPQQKSTLFRDLSLVSDAIDSFLDIIENEQENTTKNNEDVKKEVIKNE
jgi:ParB/RepB/Spo0J family partition protein